VLGHCMGPMSTMIIADGHRDHAHYHDHHHDRSFVQPIYTLLLMH